MYYSSTYYFYFYSEYSSNVLYSEYALPLGYVVERGLSSYFQLTLFHIVLFRPKPWVLTEMESSEDGVTHDRKYRQVTKADKMTIFFAIRSSMVDGKPKYGIFKKLSVQLGFKPTTVSRQWACMRRKLEHLLNNQDEDDHMGIIHTSYDILFGTGGSTSPKGKYDHNELKATVVTVEKNYNHNVNNDDDTDSNVELDEQDFRDFFRKDTSTEEE
jgi:hypothetical protein